MRRHLSMMSVSSDATAAKALPAPASAEQLVGEATSLEAIYAEQAELSAALLVEAMRARRAGSLARVRELSAEYRFKYPGGALHEEAHALSIEAAAALGESDASRLAALYLERY